MGFFSKTDKQDKWKEKFLTLLDEQEQSEKSSQEKENLFCKTIARLTIATAGLDPLLDPHLLNIRDQLKSGIDNQTLKDELEKFTDPEYIVKYFSEEYHDVMTRMGYSIDWRREFKTLDPHYQKFIEWQFRKLKAKGLVRIGEHPVKYCPEDGTRLSAEMIWCPDQKVKLEWVD